MQKHGADLRERASRTALIERSSERLSMDKRFDERCRPAAARRVVGSTLEGAHSALLSASQSEIHFIGDGSATI